MPSDCTQRTVDSTLDRFRAGRNTLEALMSTASWRTRPAAMSRHRPRPVRPSVVLSVLVASAILVPQGGGSIVSADPAGNPVTAWNEIAGEAALVCLAPTNNPLHESRMYAMLHAAIHDAVNAIDRRSQPYAFDGSTSADASVDAAVAKAAHDVLVPTLLAIPAPFPAECGQAAAAIVDAEYTATIDALPGGAAKTAGLAVGEQAAAAILASTRKRRFGHAPHRDGRASGNSTGRVSVHAGHSFPIRPRVGRRRSLRPARQFSVPVLGALQRDEQELRPGLRRGQIGRR